jgi:CheY-like chemotaxis protein
MSRQAASQPRKPGRILLADDSPHAQRMGERILVEEGYQVVTVTDGDTALIRLADVDPDLILADAFLPQKSGYEICSHVKSHPRYRHARVVLLESPLEPLDQAEARRVQADGIIKKPLEASVVLETVRPLLEKSRSDRELRPEPALAASVITKPAPSAPARIARPLPPGLDPEHIRAAVTLALDAAWPALVDEVTARVLEALGAARGAGTPARPE